MEKEDTTISFMDSKIVMFDYKGVRNLKVIKSLLIHFLQVNPKLWSWKNEAIGNTIDSYKQFSPSKLYFTKVSKDFEM